MRRAAVSVALVWALVGCSRKEPLLLEDSEGRTFSAECQENGDCTLEQTGGPRWASKTEARLHRESRLLGVCSTVAGGTVESPGDCRAIVCKSDENCPPAHGLPKGACVNGSCTEQTHEIDEKDAAMLCLWGQGLGRDTPAQVDRLSMGLNCGRPCEVPAPCRQY